MIIISQKVSSVRYADRIVVLQREIIEQGTHAELYAPAVLPAAL